MRQFLVIFVVCFVRATTDLPDEDSLSTNYDARHSSATGNGQQPSAPGADSLSVNYDAKHGEDKHEVVARSVDPLPHHPERKRRQASTITCDSAAQFRSADGTCNNLQNPTWGSINQPLRRLLDPAYSDGQAAPRLKKANGDDLPSPRTVSTGVHDFDRNRLDRRTSVMLMEWGQFLAHDLTGTPVDKGSMTSESCCNISPLNTSSDHPDVNSGGPCFPIVIEAGDRRFGQQGCMEFVRSFPVPNDQGVRQQMNELSAYLDGTNVYGRNQSEMTRLRSGTGGQLVMGQNNNLPQSSSNFCILEENGDYCLDAGDSRVNVYPALGAMHTVFARYHNNIADSLKTNHPTWDDDLLFQTARKIVIAVLQHITYSEYLPMLLGNTAMSRHGLTAEYGYNSSCDATLYNVFSTAAFRFGHSMVTDSLQIGNSAVNTEDVFNRPHHVTNNLDSLLSGMVKNPSEKADRWYSLSMTDHLFGDLDIAALNIQRGRDHGLPPYNQWRELCGESPITDFSQLPRHAINRFRNVYGDPADIDLYSGALTENGQGIVGPTYACLLGRQFASLRNCDRFWWETNDPNIGFTADQRRQIQRTKLSHVICQTTNIASIQERVFRVPDDRRNKESSCSSILANAMDVSFF